MKTLANTITKNTTLKDNTSFTFIGYFKILEYKETLLNDNISNENIYQHINKNNSIIYKDSEDFLNRVEKYINSIENKYQSNILEDFISLGYDDIKYEYKNNRNGLDRVIEKFNSLEHFSIENLIDTFELLNVSDKFYNDFFTPNSISILISKLLVQTAKLEKDIIKIYDPSCGIGRLLYHSFFELKEKYPHKIIELYGIDINNRFKVFTQSILNLINGENNYIFKANTLSNSIKIENIDICLSNPPFDKKGIEIDFVKHIKTLECHSFIILPNSFSTSKKSEEIRKELIADNLIKGIIQLPEKIFLNTNIGTSIYEIKFNDNLELKKLSIKKIQNLNLILNSNDNLIEAIANRSEYKNPEEIEKEKYKNMTLSEIEDEYNRLLKSLHHKDDIVVFKKEVNLLEQRNKIDQKIKELYNSRFNKAA